MAEYAHEAGLQIDGYTNQGAFLLNCGIDQSIVNIDDPKLQLNLTQQMKMLTLPQEMGELFKVMALSRKMDQTDMLGFTRMDRRHQLVECKQM